MGRDAMTHETPQPVKTAGRKACYRRNSDDACCRFDNSTPFGGRGFKAEWTLHCGQLHVQCPSSNGSNTSSNRLISGFQRRERPICRDIGADGQHGIA